MKALFETLAELLQGFLKAKTLWFVVPVAALVTLFLLFYANDRIPGIGGCGEGIEDTLGICGFIQNSQQMISLIAIVSLLMFVVMVAGWVIQKIRGQVFVEPVPKEEEEDDD